jgi:hypothetical protein
LIVRGRVRAIADRVVDCLDEIAESALAVEINSVHFAGAKSNEERVDNCWTWDIIVVIQAKGQRSEPLR